MNIGSKLITLGATLLTLIINYLLQLAVYEFVEREKHETKTKEKESLIIKLVIVQFINTAFIYYVISLINNKTNDDLMSASGLIYQVSSLITTSGVIQIFMNLVNHPAILRRVMLWWTYKNSPS